jgi:hypothetical protein
MTGRKRITRPAGRDIIKMVNNRISYFKRGRHRRSAHGFKALLSLSLLVICGSLLVTKLVLSHISLAGVVAYDDFDRDAGKLGPDWTAIPNGGMTISSQVVTGIAGSITGDISTAASYPSNQYSEAEVTSIPLSGREWIGLATRLQNGGRDGYVGTYCWNSGEPRLRLYKRMAGKMDRTWQ